MTKSKEQLRTKLEKWKGMKLYMKFIGRVHAYYLYVPSSIYTGTELIIAVVLSQALIYVVTRVSHQSVARATGTIVAIYLVTTVAVSGALSRTRSALVHVCK